MLSCSAPECLPLWLCWAPLSLPCSQTEQQHVCPVPPCHGTGPRAALSPGRCLAPKLALFPSRHGSSTDSLLTTPAAASRSRPALGPKRKKLRRLLQPRRCPISMFLSPFQLQDRERKGELPSGAETQGLPREGRENSRSGGTRGWASSGAGAATSRHGSGSAPDRSRPGDGMRMGTGTGTGTGHSPPLAAPGPAAAAAPVGTAPGRGGAGAVPGGGGSDLGTAPAPAGHRRAEPCSAHP